MRLLLRACLLSCNCLCICCPVSLMPLQSNSSLRATAAAGANQCGLRRGRRLLQRHTRPHLPHIHHHDRRANCNLATSRCESGSGVGCGHEQRVADFARFAFELRAAAYGESRADLAHCGGVEARQWQAGGRAGGCELRCLEQEVHAHVRFALSQWSVAGAVIAIEAATTASNVRTIITTALASASAAAASEGATTHGTGEGLHCYGV